MKTPQSNLPSIEKNDYIAKRKRECMIPLEPDTSPYTEADEYLDKVIRYFSMEDSASLHKYEENLIGKEEYLEIVRRKINQFDLSVELKDQVLKKYQKYLWSYDVIDDLIIDPSISDIKLIDPRRVIVKRKGKREISKVIFHSPEHYVGFVNRVAVRNKINLSSRNAVQSFTDITSNKEFRLRFNITTDLINSNKKPCLHIRKIPKFKRTIDELLEDGLFSIRQITYLLKAVEEGKSIIFCGKGGSGKTTLMNLLLDYVPYYSSILCIQENDELFSDYHPDIICQNTIGNREGEVQYTLKDLAKNGLLLDIDWFVVGEVKGEEARYVFDASNTGASCLLSLHANEGQGALPRLADLAKREADYSQEDILRILSSNFNLIVYMQDFSTHEILEIKGWDEENHKVIYYQI